MAPPLWAGCRCRCRRCCWPAQGITQWMWFCQRWVKTHNCICGWRRVVAAKRTKTTRLTKQKTWKHRSVGIDRSHSIRMCHHLGIFGYPGYLNGQIKSLSCTIFNKNLCRISALWDTSINSRYSHNQRGWIAVTMLPIKFSLPFQFDSDLQQIWWLLWHIGRPCHLPTRETKQHLMPLQTSAKQLNEI